MTVYDANTGAHSMRKFITYALVGLALVAGTAAAVTPTGPAVAGGCNSTTTNC
jgi:hypothetical protein